MLVTVIVCIAMALFGSFGLVITPVFDGSGHTQTLWVLFSVFLLKFPLISLLWWFIIRNKEWPYQRPKWSPQETCEILDYLLAEADRSLTLPDAEARLLYLQGEAWHVADRSNGTLKADAVDVALRIDRMRMHPHAGRRQGGPGAPADPRRGGEAP